MFTCTWIFGIVVFGAAAWPSGVLAQPSQLPPNITTCEKFERGARFNPYAIVDSMWKIFYFWSNTTEMYPIIFSLAARKRIQKFRDVFEAMNPGVDVEWEKATFVMEPRPGIEVMFMFAGTPGAYRAIVKKEQRTKERPYPGPLIKLADVRVKLVQRVMGMICCEDLTAFALIRVDEMPKTEEQCMQAAATIGYHGYVGRSYLYLSRKRNDEDL